MLLEGGRTAGTFAMRGVGVEAEGGAMRMAPRAPKFLLAAGEPIPALSVVTDG